jgi:hypothetical protein
MSSTPRDSGLGREDRGVNGIGVARSAGAASSARSNRPHDVAWHRSTNIGCWPRIRPKNGGIR